MAIAFDAASNSSGVDGTDVSSLTFAHTVTGSDTILIVGGSWRHDTGSDHDVTGVTINAEVMTETGTRQANIWGGENGTTMWRRVAPTTGNVVVTYSGTLNFCAAGAISYTGVDQTTPIGTAAGSNGASGTATVDVGSASGELVVDTMVYDDPTITEGGNQTARVDFGVGTPTISQGMSEEAGAATVTMSWTGGASDVWAIIAVPLKPASVTVANHWLLMGV